MSFDRISQGYYTTAEARKKLGVTNDVFQGWVRRGKLTRINLPGQKKSVFQKQEIDMFAANIEMTLLASSKTHLSFQKATLETQKDEFELARLNFGDKTQDFNKYRVELLQRNPDMTHYLYDNVFLVASINMVPLDDEGMEKFKRGERGWLLGEHVVPFSPGKPLNCIIIDFITTPRAPANRRKSYAASLLIGMSEELVKWGHKGIEIASIHACGGTPDGVSILEHAGFKYLGEPQPRRRMYGLNIADSDLQPIERYRDALSEYKRASEGVR